MSGLRVEKTGLAEGVWAGIVSGTGKERPQIRAVHDGRDVEGLELAQDDGAQHWILTVPIPARAISDGIQTIAIEDTAKKEIIGSITLLAGEPLNADIRAELDLLRAELELLKRAFRRHCAESHA